MPGIPTTYDSAFALVAEQSGAPFQWLRALAWMESGMNPANKTGKHWGLFQVPPEVVADYNKAHPPEQNAFTHEDMLRPEPNCAVFAWDIARIMRAMRGCGIATNWRSKDYAKIVTMGWNAGWSNAAGVCKVARWLAANKKPITHANLYKFAKVAGGAWSLQSPTKFKWQSEVAALYQRLAAAGTSALPPIQPYPDLRPPWKPGTKPAGKPLPTPAKTGEWSWLAILILAAVLLSRKS